MTYSCNMVILNIFLIQIKSSNTFKAVYNFRNILNRNVDIFDRGNRYSLAIPFLIFFI